MFYDAGRFVSNVSTDDFEIEVDIHYAENSARKLVYGRQMEEAAAAVPYLVKGPFKEQTLDKICYVPSRDGAYGVIEKASANYRDLEVSSLTALWVPLGVDSDIACDAAMTLAEACVRLVISGVQSAVTG